MRSALSAIEAEVARPAQRRVVVGVQRVAALRAGHDGAQLVSIGAVIAPIGRLPSTIRAGVRTRAAARCLDAHVGGAVAHHRALGFGHHCS